MRNLVKFIILAFITLLFCSMVIGFAGCRSVKNLSKNIQTVLQKKDSSGKSDSVVVNKDSSRFNSEVIIEYDSAKISERLLNGSDIDWDPFYSPDEFNEVIKSLDHPKRITIRTNVQIHKSDSSVYHETAKVKTAETSKTVDVKKKIKSYPWYYYGIIALVILLILFFLYKKYKSKISFLR